MDATSIFVRGLPHGTTDCQANPTPYQRKCCYCHSSEEDKDLRVFLEAGGSACCITRMILHADTGTGCFFFFFAHAVFMLSVCFFLPCAAPLLVACSRFRCGAHFLHSFSPLIVSCSACPAAVTSAALIVVSAFMAIAMSSCSRCCCCCCCCCCSCCRSHRHR